MLPYHQINLCKLILCSLMDIKRHKDYFLLMTCKIEKELGVCSAHIDTSAIKDLTNRSSW